MCLCLKTSHARAGVLSKASASSEERGGGSRGKSCGREGLGGVEVDVGMDVR